MKRITLGGRRIRVPFFAATASDDENLWPWKRGVRPDAVLISYDVLRQKSQRTSQPLARTLAFSGLMIVDSGAYGTSHERDPAAVYGVQRAVGANLGVMLDQVALTTDSARLQWAAVNQTIRYARAIRRRHRRGMTLEAVVQGATPGQLATCSRRLGALHFDAYGIPLSMQSKYRHYVAAVERVAYAMSGLPPNAKIHALGCGSRTLMAILTAIGVTIFDSGSYYLRATYGENIKSVTMCALGQPRGKAACKGCLEQRPPGRTLAARTDRNLHEILKEMTRIRCALEESQMNEYLERRLTKKVFRKVAQAVELLYPFRRLRAEVP
jgi:queuine/archaeosine tRNA-ribosyltransferase